MKKIILILLFSIKSFSQSADLNTINKIIPRCGVPNGAAPLYANDFKWGYGLPELISRFYEIYSSNKRLPKSAYWDPSQNSLMLPIAEQWGGPVPIQESFIQSIARHIEKAFELNVIDGVFFPDMGHSHLLIPDAHYQKHYRDFEVSEFSKKYEKMFQDPQIEILYHTAEQLKMLDQNNQVLDDARVKFRHKTRNLVGQNRPNSTIRFLANAESPANTAGAPEGYTWWGGGFNLSSNQAGCFAYNRNGQIFYFDISLFDLDYSPDSGGVFDNF